MMKTQTSYSSVPYRPILNLCEKYSRNGFLVEWHTYLNDIILVEWVKDINYMGIFCIPSNRIFCFYSFIFLSALV